MLFLRNNIILDYDKYYHKEPMQYAPQETYPPNGGIWRGNMPMIFKICCPLQATQTDKVNTSVEQERNLSMTKFTLSAAQQYFENSTKI